MTPRLKVFCTYLDIRNGTFAVVLDLMTRYDAIMRHAADMLCLKHVMCIEVICGCQCLLPMEFESTYSSNYDICINFAYGYYYMTNIIANICRSIS